VAAALAVLALGGLVLIVIGWLGLVGRLPRNHWAGIRTFYTMRNDENWYATHRAAGPLLIFGGVAVTAAALAFLPFAIAGKVPDRLAAAVSVALACVVFATAIASWLYGTRVARSRPGAS
jgi:uncharacterized membrane protein